MQQTPLLALHEAAGARLVGDGAREPLAFGAVPEEYAAGTDGCALLDAAGRGLVRVEGGDAAEFLHRILSNHVRGLAPGEGRRQLLLTPKGKVRHVFDLERTADGERGPRFLLSTSPGEATALMAAIDMYLFTEDAQLADDSERHAPLELLGPGADAVVASVLAGALPTSERTTAVLRCGDVPVRATRLAVAGGAGWRLDAGPDGVEALWRALEGAGARPIGRAARDILRVEACTAEPGVDVDDNLYPQEARLHDTYADDKGCYIGQEVVAKIDTYGGLNKRLTALRIEHDDFVPRGTKLVQADDQGGKPRELGVVTSWAYSFVLDTGLCLAYVKRRHQSVGTEFQLGALDAPRATVVTAPVRPSALPLQGELE